MSISQNFTATEPSLCLNFQNSKTLDPRVTFTRTSTGTYVDENGLIKTAAADEARFDHDPVTGESLGLLIEESRTNISLYSNSYVSWGFNAVTSPLPTDNTQIAPDGTQTAWQFPVGATSNLQRNYGITAGQTYTFSFFAKQGSATQMGSDNIGVNTDNSYAGVIYNWSTNTLGNGWFKIDYSNGWSRFYRTFTSSTSTLFVQRIDSAYGGGQYIWGAQLEAGSFPTSYIPTTDTSITRTSDNASIGGTNFSSWYNQYEGTYIINYKRDYIGNGVNYPGLLTTNSLLVFADGGSEMIKNQSANVQRGAGVPSLNFRKLSVFYSRSGYGGNIDGAAITEGPQLFGTNDTYLVFGVIQSTTVHRIKSIIYYPARLTNSQLQTLTK